MRAWLGWCHLSGMQGDETVLASVWCADREGFDAGLRPVIEAEGAWFFWTDEVLHAELFMARHPTSGGGELARQIHAAAPVAFGPRRTLTKAVAALPTPESPLRITEIPGITPLDAQLGIWPKKTVPDALREPLFGQPALTDADITRYGSAEAVPPLKTYAILDAAKVPLLPQMLETSGLTYRCLFKGEAYDELKTVAPYIVELTEDSDLTRQLFTRSGMPADMWDKEPGIYARSRGTLEDMWRHFRKFTRVQDEKGKWYYWRFWETRTLLSFLGARDFSQLARHFIDIHRTQSSSLFLWLLQERSSSLIEVQFRQSDQSHKPSILTDQDRQSFLLALLHRDAHDLARFLATLPVFGKMDHIYLNDLALRSLTQREKLRIRSPNGVAWMIIITYLSDHHMRAAKLLSRLIEMRTWNFDQVARMLKRGADKAQTQEKGDE